MAELRSLTGARGVAAWLVVLFHIRLALPELPHRAKAVIAHGYLAVDFFFLLSGFVIWLAWDGRLREGGWAAVPAFLQKRIARIWPLHAVILAGAAALVAGLAMTGRHDPRAFPVEEFPLHLLLLQNWGWTAALSWNHPAWSISVEWAAYLLFPLLVHAIDWRTLPSAVIVAAVGALFLLLASVFAAAGATSLGADVPRLGLVRCLVEFSAGGAIGALWWRWRDRPGLAIGMAVIAAALLTSPLPEPLRVPPALAALLLGLALAGDARNPLGWRPLHYLGEVSYATYLSHYLLWFAWKLAFVTNPRAVPAAVIASYLLAVLASSVALYHLVERPAQRLVNGWRLRPLKPFALSRD
ncbi:acyltransferase family protein [Sphingomonas guangdongensis]|uniref:acyltransferase family protein n=1 Tax=Sphingomonas guangdongensis TaxID=1141890 RepID=UPI000BE3D6FC|nr:acyltransferase [Sphingomonas guangdongensis]